MTLSELILGAWESFHIPYPDYAHMWQRPNWTNRCSTFCTSPSLRRLFTPVHHLAIEVTEQSLSESYLAVLCPVSPSAPSAFSGVRVLELRLMVPAAASPMERLFPSSAAVRCE